MLREYSSPPQRVMCHVSGVTFHVSRVTCHVSNANFIFLFIIFFLGQLGEAYRWRVCYQRGLPRLVFFSSLNKNRLVFGRTKKDLTTCM